MRQIFSLFVIISILSARYVQSTEDDKGTAQEKSDGQHLVTTETKAKSVESIAAGPTSLIDGLLGLLGIYQETPENRTCESTQFDVVADAKPCVFKILYGNENPTDISILVDHEAHEISSILKKKSRNGNLRTVKIIDVTVEVPKSCILTADAVKRGQELANGGKITLEFDQIKTMEEMQESGMISMNCLQTLKEKDRMPTESKGSDGIKSKRIQIRTVVLKNSKNTNNDTPGEDNSPNSPDEKVF